jgi:3-oxoacyl-[acyl-carrier protein] reductase
MINFKNKNVIITGASRGIGKELVFSFAKLGANVTLLSRDLKKMNNILKTLNKKKLTNQSFKALKLDISKQEDVISTFKKIVDINKSIDILINNAGITNDNIIVRMSSEQWHSVINTNLNGCFYCCKSAAKQMIKQKYGKIINICSIIAQIGNKGQSNYSASKAGIIGLTKSIAKELASRNINVNVINPGYIDTEMTNKLTYTIKDSFLKDIPLKRFGSVKDVSSLACFLSSDESNYITGQVINVDGGIAI